MKRDWPSTKAWKQALACLAVAALGWPQAAPPVAAAEAVEAGRPVYPGAVECPYDLPPHRTWQKQETWAWKERICLGKIADMSQFGGGDGLPCDPEEADDWPDTRDLTSAFLETILNHEPYRGALPRTGARIQCARFNKALDLSNTVLARSLWLYASRFRQNVLLKDLRSSSLVLLNGSVFDGLFNAVRVAVAGNLFIRNARFKKEVRLFDAKVGGELYASGSTFDGPFNADGLEVAGSLFMDEGADKDADKDVAKGAHFKEEVRLLGAKVGGELSAIGSTFEGLFNADRLEVAGNLFMSNGAHFKKEVRLLSAKVGGQLAAAGSTFDGRFSADGLEVAGDLFMSNGAHFKKEVRLPGAKVGGQLSAMGSTFDGRFTADGLEVAGSLFMSNGAYFKKEVRLPGAKVGGVLSAIGSTFDGLLIADHLEVAGDLFMHGGAHFNDVDLLGAKVGGQLAAVGSTFEGLFNADDLAVAGSLFMRDGASFKDVDLNSAVIGKHLQLWDSDFDGHLNLTSVSIEKELQLNSPRHEPPRWTKTSRLTLRNARVGALNDTEDAWKNIERGRLDLVGFTYDRLGGLGATGKSAMSARTTEWLRDWLSKQDGFDTSYNPQPFEQLAKVLRESGYPGKADAILFAARDHQRDSPATPWLTQVKLWLLWGLIGYGYHNWIAFIWFAALTGLGVAVCRVWASGLDMRAAQRFWYSVDMALPLINLNRRHEDVKLRGGVLVYFYGHKLAGFVLVSFLVAGLSGLTK